MADQDQDDVYELYSRAIDGSGAPVKLNSSLSAGRFVNHFDFAPNSQSVVYGTGQDVDTDPGHLQPAQPTAVALQSNSMARCLLAQCISSFGISPDSRWVLYGVMHDGGELVELFSRPTDGSGSPVRLSGTANAEGDVYDFDFSPDSQRVVYSADEEGD